MIGKHLQSPIQFSVYILYPLDDFGHIFRQSVQYKGDATEVDSSPGVEVAARGRAVTNEILGPEQKNIWYGN